MIPLELFSDKLIFFGLTDEQLMNIAELSEEVVYSEGDTICREGDAGDSMFIVAAGKVNVFKKGADGNENLLATLPSGSVFGEMTLINVEPRSATVKASEDAAVVILKNYALSEIFNEDRELFIVVLMNITRVLSRRLREANEKLMQ